jgi:RND superfamily putative drug exporter
MARWSNLVLGHKRLVVLLWLLWLVPAGVATTNVADRLSMHVALPGQPAYEANQEILRRYGSGGAKLPLVPVVALPPGQRVDGPGARQALERAFTTLAKRSGLRVISYANTGDSRFVAADRHTTFGLVFLADQSALGAPDLAPMVTDTLAEALPSGWTVRVTGLEQLELGPNTSGPAALTETLLAALGALVVLAFVFGSLLAFVPVLIAAVSIPTVFALIFGLTEITSVSFFVEYIVALIGLGVAIDYSLLLVTRWREERAAGHTGDDAVHRAMVSAGHAVLFSGLTVAVGLVSLVVLPVPFLRAVGYAGVLIPLVSVLATLTLLPVLLAKVGDRLDWPHLRRGRYAGRGWFGWARAVVRHRWLATLLALAILVPLGVSALDLRLGTPRSDSLVSSGPATDGLILLQRAGITTGVLTPLDVLVPAGTDPQTVATALNQVHGVYAATTTADPAWRRAGTGLVVVLPQDETGTGAGRDTIARVRDAAAGLPGVRVGGFGPQDVDYIDAVYGRFPLMLTLIAVVTFLVLIRAFRSILLPLKAIVLNLLSVGAVYGVIKLVWQDGHGSTLWGIPATGAVEVFVPLLVFAFLYGLSMDYEVFIVARIREEYDRAGDTRLATIEGIARTGRLVTSAALILLLAFLSLASGPIVTVKVFATALGAGIILDATIVRALLVPALMSLFGRWNWWLPAPVARVVGLPATAAKPTAERPDAAAEGGGTPQEEAPLHAR